jgi:DNA-binding CsgD family transcriptional regulator
MLRGEPGVGKTALLRYASHRAQDMTVLQAQGLEVEAHLAFSGLADLFRPVVDRLDAIPQPQSAALAGALGLGPAVAGDRFLVCASTLSLLAAAAEDRPVLAFVDDLHWVDVASREALLFAARRLDAENVTMLITRRDWDTAIDSSGLDELTVAGLDRDAAAELLEELGRPVPVLDLDRLMEATGGNPLALRELTSSFTNGPGRAPTATTVERAFLRRIGGLPAPTRDGLVVVASDSGVRRTILEACALLGLPGGCLQSAEEAGVIQVEGDRIAFTHPLLRSAVYYAAPELTRQRVHRALAETLDETSRPAKGPQPLGPSSTERRAWQLGAASREPDESVAATLEAAASEARNRSGYAAAAAGLERAARLTPLPQDRIGRLVESARHWHLAGQVDTAAALLDEALELAAPGSRTRAPIQHLRGRIDMSRGRFSVACELLATEATAVAETDSQAAALMLMDASISASTSGAVGRGVELARESWKLAKPVGGHLADAARVVLGGLLEAHGEWLDEEECRRVVDAASSLAQLKPPPPVVAMSPVVLIGLEEYDRARTLLDGFHDDARALGAPTILVPVLLLRSDVGFRTGDWIRAYADGAESLRLARDTGQLGFHSLAFLARIEAARGLEADCRVHALEALDQARRLGIGATQTYARWALGLLALGLGHMSDATAELEQVAGLVEEHEMRHPVEVPWAADLVEAYVRSGRQGDAAKVLTRFETDADRARLPSALAAASRCRGLLRAEGGFAADFEQALAFHDRVPTPFERARTELCYGERLRRSRRRSDARAHLRTALETFERLDADPWATRARSELAATGETVAPKAEDGVRSLTPQELQLGLIVGRGATNKEAAAALFISPKTVEAHLHRIYVKLGIRSRTELARLLARAQMLD